MEGWRRYLGQGLQRRHERRQGSFVTLLEEHELAFFEDDLDCSDQLFDVAIDAQDDSCALTLDLHRLELGPPELLSRAEAAEHPADRRRLVARPTRAARA